MQPDEQLEWEQRAGRPAGASMLAAGVLLLLSVLLSARAAGDDAFDTYLSINDDASLILLPNIVQAIAYLLMAYGLWYLARSTAARRPELAAPTRVMALLGPVATAIALVLTALAVLEVAQAAADVARPPRGEEARDNLLEDLQSDSGLLTAASIVTYVSRIALGFALVLGSLNAMRAGLLSRFLGVLGIIAGALSVLFGGAGVIVAFWLGATGLIFMNRWPGGRGPAWEVVESIPWPTAADRHRAELEERGELVKPDENGHDDEVLVDDDDDEDDLVEHDEDSQPATVRHPSSKKRKRKKRR